VNCLVTGGAGFIGHNLVRTLLNEGHSDKSLANLEACVDEKRRRPDSRTQVAVGFIVMRHNEHEVEDFARFAQEIGVDDYNVVYPCARNMEQARQFLPERSDYWIYDREAFDQGILRPAEVSNHYCEWLYFTTTIQVNGDVVPCCRDPRGQYVLGNVFDQNFVSDIWNGEPYREFRHTVAHQQGDASICDLCSGYTAPDTSRHELALVPMSIESTVRAPSEVEVVS
jgi:radical SAM protein with 4Fe4S-binding SPASM domain